MKNKFEIIRELKFDLIHKAKLKIKDLILFGSQVEGTATEDSDYDILIIIDQEDSSEVRRKVSDVSFDFFQKYEIFLDIFTATVSDVDTINNKTPLIDDAVTQGIFI